MGKYEKKIFSIDNCVLIVFCLAIKCERKYKPISNGEMGINFKFNQCQSPQHATNVPSLFVDGDDSTYDNINAAYYNAFKLASPVDVSSFYLNIGYYGTVKFYNDTGAELISKAFEPGQNTFPLTLSQVQYLVIKPDSGVAIYEFSLNQTPPPSLPDAPLNLQGTAGSAKVDLSWSFVNTATGYNVKRSLTQGGPYTTIVTGVTGTTYTDTTAVNGTTYYYVVTTVNTSGEYRPHHLHLQPGEQS